MCSIHIPTTRFLSFRREICIEIILVEDGMEMKDVCLILNLAEISIYVLTTLSNQKKIYSPRDLSRSNTLLLYKDIVHAHTTPFTRKQLAVDKNMFEISQLA